MASIKNQLEKAVYSALTAEYFNPDTLGFDYLINKATGGIIDENDKSDAINYPFVTFGFQGFQPTDYSFQFGQSIQDGFLIVKSYADSESILSTDSIKDFNDAVLEICKLLLHNVSMSLDSGTLLTIYEYAPMPDVPEQLSDRRVIGSGKMFKVVAQ